MPPILRKYHDPFWLLSFSGCQSSSLLLAKLNLSIKKKAIHFCGPIEAEQERFWVTTLACAVSLSGQIFLRKLFLMLHPFWRTNAATNRYSECLLTFSNQAYLLLSLAESVSPMPRRNVSLKTKLKSCKSTAAAAPQFAKSMVSLHNFFFSTLADLHLWGRTVHRWCDYDCAAVHGLISVNTGWIKAWYPSHYKMIHYSENYREFTAVADAPLYWNKPWLIIQQYRKR